MKYLNVFAAIYQQCANWQRLVLNKLFGVPVDEICMRSGVKFKTLGRRLGPADLSMLAEIWAHQYYNPPFFGIAQTDLVFDVGANNGYFTLYAAKAASAGKVYAFEPVPTLAGLISANAGLNGFKNVTVEKLALAKQDGQSDFYVSPSHNGCHSLFRRSNEDSVIKVATKTLENYCREHSIERIDFLKLDCEGAEYEIILNLDRQFLDKVSKISMELHDNIINHTHEELIEFLRAQGFYVAVKNWYLFAFNPKLYDPEKAIEKLP